MNRDEFKEKINKIFDTKVFSRSALFRKMNITNSSFQYHTKNRRKLCSVFKSNLISHIEEIVKKEEESLKEVKKILKTLK